MNGDGGRDVPRRLAGSCKLLYSTVQHGSYSSISWMRDEMKLPGRHRAGRQAGMASLDGCDQALQFLAPEGLFCALPTVQEVLYNALYDHTVDDTPGWTVLSVSTVQYSTVL